MKLDKAARSVEPAEQSGTPGLPWMACRGASAASSGVQLELGALGMERLGVWSRARQLRKARRSEPVCSSAVALEPGQVGGRSQVQPGIVEYSVFAGAGRNEQGGHLCKRAVVKHPGCGVGETGTPERGRSVRWAPPDVIVETWQLTGRVPGTFELSTRCAACRRN